MSAKVTTLNFAEKKEGHVFSGENGQNQQIRTQYGVNTDSIRPELTKNLADLLNQVDQEIAEQNQYGLEKIQELLCSKTVATQLRGAIKNHEGATFSKYLVGLDAALDSFEVGTTLNITVFQEQAAKKSDELSITFIRDRIKPILEQYKILLKREDNTFRWATLEELEAQLQALKPANDLQMNGEAAANAEQKPAFSVTAICNKPIRILRTRANAKRLAKAKADPFAKVTQDGQIQYLPRPYLDDLSEDEKTLLRKVARAEAKEKLEGKLHSLSDKEFQRQLRAAEQAAMQQAVAMNAEAAARVAEIAARRQVRNAKLAGYVPVVSVAGLFVFGLFVINNANQGIDLDAGHPAYTNVQAAGMYPPEYPEQVQEDIEEAMRRLDAEIPNHPDQYNGQPIPQQ